MRRTWEPPPDSQREDRIQRLAAISSARYAIVLSLSGGSANYRLVSSSSFLRLYTSIRVISPIDETHGNSRGHKFHLQVQRVVRRVGPS